MKMNINRAQELLVPLKNGTANGISLEWSARLIEALEYVIEHEAAQPAGEAVAKPLECICLRSPHPGCPIHGSAARR